MNKKLTSTNSQTDWERLDAMEDDNIDLSDCPEITPEMFAKTLVRKSLPSKIRKTQVTLAIDSDVLEWFEHQTQDYQNQINCILKDYMRAHQ